MRIIATLLFTAAVLHSQTFEVVSVKPAGPGAHASIHLRGGPGTNDPSRLSGTVSLRTLLIRAYSLKTWQILAPAWIDSANYEIAAKLPPEATEAQVDLMLQAMLAERFHLVARRQSRRAPLYALLCAKGGPRLQAATTSSGAVSSAGPIIKPGPDGFPSMAPGEIIRRSYESVIGGADGIMYKLWARHETMTQLADRLSNQLNRTVVDKTTLKGAWDFTLAWTVDSVGGNIPITDPPPDEIDSHPSSPVMSGPALSLFTAVQAQLGLRLKPETGPQEALIVDQADRVPSGN